MAEDRRGNHEIAIKNRETLDVTGVLEVLAFDEESVMMETSCGLLMIKGQGIHMGKLDLTSGDVSIQGMVDSITYSDGSISEKHWLLGKLFR